MDIEDWLLLRLESLGQVVIIELFEKPKNSLSSASI